ncbi:hypothetical protein B0T16DRAFT_75913 [Cercophora newfieldiana]|uniref:Uncharacterized protein n=1 Tax=Cercophora newfieldiana TaxID=92897 RepID=A0AA39YGU8_9PEZI|nr:hypothetical protein B0T16DRAFT_75913 [Cercophora newfieldiana]
MRGAGSSVANVRLTLRGRRQEAYTAQRGVHRPLRLSILPGKRSHDRSSRSHRLCRLLRPITAAVLSLLLWRVQTRRLRANPPCFLVNLFDPSSSLSHSNSHFSSRPLVASHTTPHHTTPPHHTRHPSVPPPACCYSASAQLSPPSVWLSLRGRTSGVDGWVDGVGASHSLGLAMPSSSSETLLPGRAAQEGWMIGWAGVYLRYQVGSQLTGAECGRGQGGRETLAAPCDCGSCGELSGVVVSGALLFFFFSCLSSFLFSRRRGRPPLSVKQLGGVWHGMAVEESLEAGELSYCLSCLSCALISSWLEGQGRVAPSTTTYSPFLLPPTGD